MKGWGRWVPVGAMGVFAALFLALGREVSLSELLAWTPEGLWFGAALAVLSLWLGCRMWRRTPEG